MYLVPLATGLKPEHIVTQIKNKQFKEAAVAFFYYNTVLSKSNRQIKPSHSSDDTQNSSKTTGFLIC